jgi:hypothetical protein
MGLIGKSWLSCAQQNEARTVAVEPDATVWEPLDLILQVPPLPARLLERLPASVDLPRQAAQALPGRIIKRGKSPPHSSLAPLIRGFLPLELHELLKTYTINVEKTLKNRGFLFENRDWHPFSLLLRPVLSFNPFFPVPCPPFSFFTFTFSFVLVLEGVPFSGKLSCIIIPNLSNQKEKP